MRSLSFVFFFLFLSSLSFASGFQLYSEGSAEALSLSGALIGRQGMTSQAWYNPAALSSVETTSMMAGFSSLKFSSKYKFDGGTQHLVNDWRPTGYFYLVHPLDKDFSLNLSINAPYGMITHWKHNWVGKHIATFTNARFIYLTPSMTYKVNDELSLAGGINIVYGTARLHRYLPALKLHDEVEVLGVGAKTFAENKMVLRADGFGVGFTASAHYQPVEDWGFGLVYQSRVRIHMKGQAHYRYQESYEPPHPAITAGIAEKTGSEGPYGYRRANADTYITLPSSIGFGIANTTFEDWTFSFDTVWTEWSTYDDMYIHFKKHPVTMDKRTNRDKVNNWNNVMSFRFGAEYQLNENWALRGGYMYDQAPAKDSYRSPEMPDNNRHMFTLGCGYSKDNWGIDLAYAYLMLEDAIMGSTVANDATGRGTFKSDVHIVAAAVKYHF